MKMRIKSYSGNTLLLPSSSAGRVAAFLEHAAPEDLSHRKPGIAILGISCDCGVRNVGGRPGAALGPEAFRKKFYRLASPDVPVIDVGDLESAGTAEATHAHALELLLRIRRAGHFPLVVGGGHDLAFPEALSLLKHLNGKPAAFLNVDAHLDVRDTSSGITSGSPWYLLAEDATFQRSGSRIHEFGIQPHANAQNLFQYAARKKISITPFESIRNGKTQFRSLLQRLGKKNPVQVSLDVDSVQWADAPGVSAPQNTGFTAAEAIAFSRTAGAHGAVYGFGIYEFCPPHDRDDQTASLVARCVLAFVQGFATRKIRR